MPASREILRTTRDSLSKTCPSGTMRTSRMPACSSSSLRDERAQLVVQRRAPAWSARVSALTRSRIACSPARAMPSSPTMFIRLSSLRMSTRTVCATDLSDSSSSSRSPLRASPVAAGFGADGAAAASRGTGAVARGAASARRRAVGCRRGSSATTAPRARRPPPAPSRSSRRRAEDHVELDLLIVGRLRRRQVGDHLADRLEPRLELVEPLVDGHQIERRVDAVAARARP